MCLKQGCSIAQKTLFHGSEKIISQKRGKTKETTAHNVTSGKHKTDESPVMPSVTDVKGLMQITEDNLQSPSKTEEVLVLCDSACGHSRISPNAAKKIESARHNFETYDSRN